MATKQDDLDFQVEGIEVDKLSPEEKAIYDRLNPQFRKAYLQKTQSLAEERKSFSAREKELTDIKQQLLQAQNQVKEFNDWWVAEGQYMTPRQQQQAMREEGLEAPEVLKQEITALRRDLQVASKQYGEMLTDMKTRGDTLEQAMRIQNDLWELRWKHKDQGDFDAMKVLETAKEKGLNNLELAYNLAYGEDIRKREVESEVEKRMQEAEEKRSAEQKLVETKPTSTKYAPPAEPKTYAEAGESVLAAVRGSGSTPGTLE